MYYVLYPVMSHPVCVYTYRELRRIFMQLCSTKVSVCIFFTQFSSLLSLSLCSGLGHVLVRIFLDPGTRRQTETKKRTEKACVSDVTRIRRRRVSIHSFLCLFRLLFFPLGVNYSYYTRYERTQCI